MTGNFLKPESAGYGWGWFVVLIYYLGGLAKAGLAGRIPDTAYISLYLLCIPLVLVVYFPLRKIFIEKRKFSQEIWINSLVAGMVTFVISFLLVFLVLIFFRVIGYQSVEQNDAAIIETFHLDPHAIAAIGYCDAARELDRKLGPNGTPTDAEIDQYFGYFKKALDEARQADIESMNNNYKDSGDHFKNEFMKGIELMLEAHQAGDQNKIDVGDNLLKAFSVWWQANVYAKYKEHIK
jgi:hypothetical protein